MAFLAALPFTEIDEAGAQATVRLKSLTTQDLPQGYNNSMGFLKDEGSGIKEKILRTSFFNIVYEMLGYMESRNIQYKKETLLEMMYLVVRSSTSGTSIKESVAERCLTNALRWLEKMDLIDSDLNPIHKDLVQPENQPIHFWWVNQGKTHQVEKSGGYLWAPKRGKSGTSFANTIEFNDVKLDHFDFLQGVPEAAEPVNVANEQLSGAFLNLKDAYEVHRDFIHQVTAELVKINQMLQKADVQVGYRVRDEVCFYMIYNQQADLMTFDEALDFQLHQKILPRLSGSDGSVEKVLTELYRYCTGAVYEGYDSESGDTPVQGRFPKSGRKINGMLGRLGTDGFTSFWI